MIDFPTSPYVESLPEGLDPPEAFRRISHFPQCIWLDSALAGDPQSRFSFLAADPIDVMSVDRVTADPLVKLESWLAKYRSQTVADLPPFQGGAAGFMGYELGRCFERLPTARHNEFGLPLANLGLYDVVLAWDHGKNLGWIISQGFSECRSETLRMEAAKNRCGFFWRLFRPNVGIRNRAPSRKVTRNDSAYTARMPWRTD